MKQRFDQLATELVGRQRRSEVAAIMQTHQLCARNKVGNLFHSLAAMFGGMTSVTD